MSEMNRLGNSQNPYQGPRKRVLCVCSAGLLRSPTMAWVLSNEPYGYNTRAAGIATEYALIPVDKVLLTWAQEIVCAEEWQAREVQKQLGEHSGKPVISLDLPDQFEYRNDQLVALIKERYDTMAALIKKHGVPAVTTTIELAP